MASNAQSLIKLFPMPNPTRAARTSNGSVVGKPLNSDPDPFPDTDWRNVVVVTLAKAAVDVIGEEYVSAPFK